MEIKNISFNLNNYIETFLINKDEKLYIVKYNGFTTEKFLIFNDKIIGSSYFFPIEGDKGYFFNFNLEEKIFQITGFYI
jgi:hypothetical protein